MKLPLRNIAVIMLACGDARLGLAFCLSIRSGHLEKQWRNNGETVEKQWRHSGETKAVF
jgi:hypothetical protein